MRTEHTITEYQRGLLRECLVNEGFTSVPGGYRGAGPDASRWWRSVGILVSAGLLRQTPGRDGAWITAAGNLAYHGLPFCDDTVPYGSRAIDNQTFCRKGPRTNCRRPT